MPVSSGRRDKYVTVQTKDGLPVDDNNGGFTQAYKDLGKVFASIEPATAKSLERFRSNTIIATASHVVAIPYMSGISTDARIVFGKRILNVQGYYDPDERQVELVLGCEELAQPTIKREDIAS